jgi:hypothetical protein
VRKKAQRTQLVTEEIEGAGLSIWAMRHIRKVRSGIF